MKTREEIERVYDEGCRAVWAAHEPQLNAISAAEAAELDALAEKRKAALDALAEKRKAALAELDDPMARLIAAAKKALPWLSPDAKPRYARERYEALRDLRDAIAYAEQRRAQG